MADPEAIGVIPDGNRRYARKMGISLQEGYVRGIQKAEELMNYLVERTKTRVVYFYTLSLENLRKRSATELSFLFNVFKKRAKEILLNNPWNARIRFIGRRSALPKELRDLQSEVEKKTENNDGPTIVLAMGYTGLAEVTDMVRSITREVLEGRISPDEIDENTVLEHLYTGGLPIPDAIVRTSGEMRTSGFLPVQSVYAELIFYPKYWPELEYEDFERILNEFRSRGRRFGR